MNFQQSYNSNIDGFVNLGDATRNQLPGAPYARNAMAYVLAGGAAAASWNSPKIA